MVHKDKTKAAFGLGSRMMFSYIIMPIVFGAKLICFMILRKIRLFVSRLG